LSSGEAFQGVVRVNGRNPMAAFVAVGLERDVRLPLLPLSPHFSHPQQCARHHRILQRFNMREKKKEKKKKEETGGESERERERERERKREI
jgi:hypothetical protein